MSSLTVISAFPPKYTDGTSGHHGQDFEDVSSIMEAAGMTTLRMDAMLWEGSKVLQDVPVPPDLTASLWYHLGCAQARLGGHLEAVETFQRVHQMLPNHPAILHELATCQMVCLGLSHSVRERIWLSEACSETNGIIV